MRIGAFEVSLTFRESMSIAEVISGRGRLLESFSVRNIRGSEKDWLRIHAAWEGYPSSRQKSIRNLGVQDESNAMNLSREVMDFICIPSSAPPGLVSGQLIITCLQGEILQPFHITILSQGLIPTDYSRADFTAAWIRTQDPTLRNYTSMALSDQISMPSSVRMQTLYESLQSKGLLYHAVPTTIRQDYVNVLPLKHVLEHGGSCVDLSLLYASMLWNAGCTPVLFLLRDHMMAGCFVQEKDVPEQEVCCDTAEIRRLLTAHKLLAVQVTGICDGCKLSWMESVLKASAQLQNQRTSCAMVNIRSILRNGQVLPLNDTAPEPEACPVCGHLLSDLAQNSRECPACGSPLKQEVAHITRPIAPAKSFTPGNDFSWLSTNRGLSVSRYTGRDESLILPERWMGSPVVSIGPNAFKGHQITGVVMPDTLLTIGDGAFAGCGKLTSLHLPDTLCELGFGAFIGTGLSFLKLPDTLERIPVRAFAECSSLTHIQLQEGLTEIGAYAFAGCTSLAQVVIPASVRNIGTGAFPDSCRVIRLSPATLMER